MLRTAFPDSELAPQAAAEELPRTAAQTACFHCGTRCPTSAWTRGDKAFCCHGCLTVFELLTENGLGEFYQLKERAGVRVGQPAQAEDFRFVDDPAVRQRLVDYSDEHLTRIRFRLPAIHCIACVWLLENLFRMKPGIGHSEVNFPRKEVSICFEPALVRLSEVIALLSGLGYSPELKLSDLQARPKPSQARRLWLQIGIAGFAFGNTMLFSIATYAGLDTFSGPAFRKLVGLISFFLAIPVVVFSASDYWRSAWTSLRRRTLHIDVPIAAGILALFGQSTWEACSGAGNGYFDSLAGLVFFLLCGRAFQQKTFDRLAFDRDYRCFFPLSVKRCVGGTEETVSLSKVQPGDELVLRNGELIPADSRLLAGPALIDYSFVTGESEPVEKCAGDYLYAGGRQVGTAIRVRALKNVSQSYLTSLWDQEAFRKSGREQSLNTVTNRYSRRFTILVLGIAVGAALFWAYADPAKSLKAFTSVLIVACPCALALAAPFALGTAQRVLARRKVFLRNPAVLESLASADALVFDKTGTLTTAVGEVAFEGEPLSQDETAAIRALTGHSTHPNAARLTAALPSGSHRPSVDSFEEIAGAGIRGFVHGREIRIGSVRWASGAHGISDGYDASARATVHVSIDQVYRGSFRIKSALRCQADHLMTELAQNYRLSLLSGDHERERERFQQLLGPTADLHFNQSPIEKLAFIQRLQRSGRTVIMVGDGLNDAGALKQSDVGVAVVENINAFSPASDVILAAEMLPQLGQVARFSRTAVRIVHASFVISSLYNVVGISIAAGGLLAPVICAVLMPLSSVTVVAFACGLTHWFGRRILGFPFPEESRVATSGILREAA